MNSDALSQEDIVAATPSAGAATADAMLQRLTWIASQSLGLPTVALVLGAQPALSMGVPAQWVADHAAQLGALGALLPATGAPLIVADVLHGPPQLRDMPQIGACVLHALPSAAHARAGYMLFGDPAPRQWQAAQLELIDAFANQAADLVRLRGGLVEQGELSPEATIRALLRTLPNLVFRFDKQGRYVDYKAPQDAVLFVLPEEFLGRLVEDVLPAPLAAQTRQAIEQALRTGETQAFEYQIALPTGYVYDYEARIVPVGSDDAVAIMRDISQRKRLETQLLQLQKIESVGQLSGGIAHDFNNLLTAIIGYADLALLSLDHANEIYVDVDEIRRAAERAASLTRQLLAFARWQVLELRSVRLNDLLFDVYKLLRRLIGENIELSILPNYTDAWVKADAGQIEQVLVNLAINARDAMPLGGRLSIELSQRIVTPEKARRLTGLVAGSYIMLTISDTGMGMDTYVKSHLFEPFFTTKEKGRGTGLGLAMCYGIIKQHGGAIDVSSAVGAGTTIEIYLPQAPTDDDPIYRLGHPAGRLPRGNEAILLVEDEPAVRVLAARILRAQGYIVFEAENGDEALSIARERGRAALHLLLTDVVMPRMSGKTLAERMTAIQPDVKVLFISGYTNELMISQGTLDLGLAFLHKPFTPAALAQKVREVLDS